jgi:hypothetical protein
MLDQWIVLDQLVHYSIAELPDKRLEQVDNARSEKGVAVLMDLHSYHLANR